MRLIWEYYCMIFKFADKYKTMQEVVDYEILRLLNETYHTNTTNVFTMTISIDAWLPVM